MWDVSHSKVEGLRGEIADLKDKSHGGSSMDRTWNSKQEDEIRCEEKETWKEFNMGSCSDASCVKKHACSFNVGRDRICWDKQANSEYSG